MRKLRATPGIEDSGWCCKQPCKLTLRTHQCSINIRTSDENLKTVGKHEVNILIINQLRSNQSTRIFSRN